MKSVCGVILALCLASAQATSFPDIVRSSLLKSIDLGFGKMSRGGESLGSAVAGFLGTMSDSLRHAAPAQSRSPSSPPPGGNGTALLPDGFYRIIPTFEGAAALPGKPAVQRNGVSQVVSYESRCFSSNAAKVVSVADGSITISIEGSGPAKGATALTPCTEMYLVMHPGDVQLTSIKTDGSAP